MRPGPRSKPIQQGGFRQDQRDYVQLGPEARTKFRAMVRKVRWHCHSDDLLQVFLCILSEPRDDKLGCLLGQ